VPNVLSVRKAGEIVGRRVEEPAGPIRLTAQRFVILIHGYQTSAESAERSYRRFSENLRAATRDGGASLGSVLEFHWPGDHPRRPVSVVTFAGKIANARLSGDLLVRTWLRDRRGKHVVLVGHSLGCRVALETVQAILEDPTYGGAEVDAVFLLAAAVPVPLCVPPETFSIPIGNESQHVFYSRQDRVLRLAFTPGEYLAGEGGPAVGSRGEPLGTRWTGRHETFLGHGEYWGNAEVARRIAEVLRVHREQTPTARHLPAWPPFERRPGFVRRLARRVLSRR
jgi:pimeloyl-ACP methyl ester carboxylesterase